MLERGVRRVLERGVRRELEGCKKGVRKGS